MSSHSPVPGSLSRRTVLALAPAAALLGSVALPHAAMAQDQGTEPVAPLTPRPVPFSFELLAEEMRVLASQSYQPVDPVDGSFLNDLTYDDYRNIQFRPDRARWQGEGSSFQMAVFHMGWLFNQPISVFEVDGGMARELAFSTDDFFYHNGLDAKVPHHQALPGVAGVRLNTQLNRPDTSDELVAFLGASYFRALGRGNGYGLSARGLAINTGLSQGEEFPRFSRFYMERPAPLSDQVTMYAALESASCTGAFRFVINPGESTVMDVTLRLFFRNAVEQIGIAPLTSMFLYSAKNRKSFDDYRPNVHDSDGLLIEQRGGDVLWRPLNNPSRLAGSYFSETSPISFGLYQRDRDFENYQDAMAHYERRPSAKVEPIGDWGKGAVRLVEIPTDLEVNDNIVAFWVPEGRVAAGEARDYAYRLSWGALEPDAAGDIAYVYETRAGHAGVSGTSDKRAQNSRKFVIDFKGGTLAGLPEDAGIEPVVTISGGTITTEVLQKISGTDIWRLVVDVKAGDAGIVEMGAHIRGYGKKLTETWLYQWIV